MMGRTTMLLCLLLCAASLVVTAPSTVGPADLKSKSFSSLIRPEGFTATLPCNVTSASPITSVTWHKDGKVLKTSSEDRLSGGDRDDPSLVIDPLRVKDGGMYVCTVHDKLGSNHSTIPLDLIVQRRKGRLTQTQTVARAVMAPLMAGVLLTFVGLIWHMGRRGLLPRWCLFIPGNNPQERLSESLPKTPSGALWNLDLEGMGRASADLDLLQHSQALTLHAAATREACQTMIPLMKPAEVKAALYSLAYNLPLHHLPFLGLCSPLYPQRVVMDPAPDWCVCGHCVDGEPAADQVRCGHEDCVTRFPVFLDLCLKPHVVEIVGIQNLSQGLGDKESLDFSPEQFRRQALRFFVLWQWGKSGLKNFLIPSCVGARIRWAYPDTHAQGAK